MAARIKYVSWLPPRFYGMAPFPWLVLIHKDMLERTPQVRNRVIGHEMVHITQMKREGYFKWLLKYFLSGQWRAIYELEAFASNIVSLVGHSFVPKSLADSYIERILERYYPWWWPFNFGKPTKIRCQAILKAFIDDYVWRK